MIHRTVRDIFTSDTKELKINDKGYYKEILDFLDLISPELKGRVKYFDPGINIFNYFGIEKMIQEALSRKVWLKSGGYIVIDKTEAFTIIDINTGKYVGVNDLTETIVKINKEAAKEIAKQIRLRDIGGIIIIDFIDMSDKKSQQEVIDILKEALAKDRVRTNILGITQLGLLEMTRKKVRNRISSILETKCPYCEGTGKVLTPETIINNLEQELKRISVHTNSEAVLVKVHPEIERVLLMEKRDYLKEVEKNFSLKVFIKGNKEMHINDYDIVFMGKLDKVKEIIES